MANKPGQGRKSLYKPEYHIVVKNATKMGMGISEVCDLLDIGTMTFWRWYYKYPAFAESVEIGREHADKRVIHALYTQACIGTVGKKTKTVTNTKTGEVIITEEETHFPPNPGSTMYWLKCRDGNNWNPKDFIPEDPDSDESIEHTVTINVIPPKSA